MSQSIFPEFKNASLRNLFDFAHPCEGKIGSPPGPAARAHLWAPGPAPEGTHENFVNVTPFFADSVAGTGDKIYNNATQVVDGYMVMRVPITVLRRLKNFRVGMARLGSVGVKKLRDEGGLC